MSKVNNLSLKDSIYFVYYGRVIFNNSSLQSSDTHVRFEYFIPQFNFVLNTLRFHVNLAKNDDQRESNARHTVSETRDLFTSGIRNLRAERYSPNEIGFVFSCHPGRCTKCIHRIESPLDTSSPYPTQWCTRVNMPVYNPYV